MKNRKAILMVSSILGALSVAWVALAEDDDPERPSLRGISTLFVNVEDMTPEAEAIGFTVGRIKTIVELRLRTLGMTLASRDQAVRTALPTLYVNVHLMKLDNFRHAVGSVQLHLKQLVILARDPSRAMLAATWTRGALYVTPLESAQQQAETTLMVLVDAFANDYLAENPRTSTTQPSAPNP